MSFRPFTQPWADALCEALNGDAAYRDAAARWAWPLAMVLEPTPALGYAEPVATELVLDHGTCRAATVLAPGAVTEVSGVTVMPVVLIAGCEMEPGIL